MARCDPDWLRGATQDHDPGGEMKSAVIKRSVVISGHKTSVSIEDIFWMSLKENATDERMNLSNLVGSIDAQRAEGSNLSSAIRVFILTPFKGRAQALTARAVHASGLVAMQRPHIAAMRTD
jgi:predicted DNA-binding ribbon-helix-helix protein